MASCTGSQDACTSNDNNEKPTRNENHQEVCYETPTCKFDYCVKRPDYVAMQLTSAEANEKSVHAGALVRQLSFLDRFLVLWILIAMIVGVVIGYYVPSVQTAFQTVQFHSVSVPIAVGLLVMMYPVLCKVQYERLPSILVTRQVWVQIGISVFINWIIGPIIMTALAWATLPDLPGFRTGVVMVGLARCIAMVLIWNHLADGDADYCALLVAINSILQIALFSPYSVLFINIIPSWFGASIDSAIHVDVEPVAISVLIYLGIPLAAGAVTRFTLMGLFGRKWYENKFLPWVGPWALIGLLYTIIVMFANQGHQIIDNIGSVFRVAVPLFVYFVIMFFIPFFVLKRIGIPYELVVTQAFTAGSNNFELAIAVAVGTYGIHSEQALAATIGPLIEVPVLLCLTYVALLFRNKLQWHVRPFFISENKNEDQ
ncbi:arsenical-resistance protein [Lichtheimia ornata]|uniref:Arsenical-resistance protein n=1 Tax=Lichtheimia ornata TaxID=688661 RepID=A0AAD7XY81_9FUNG|nr:arsenical-resistance protein [Lichtheimia ornata]KAJ8657261.1 arsenical-resistance protein [Lichtheimia ornata]